MECMFVLTRDQTDRGERTQQPEGNSSIEPGYPCNFVDGARPILQVLRDAFVQINGHMRTQIIAAARRR
jgi:hypothetical protein